MQLPSMLYVTIFSNSSIIPTSFKFTELHALTLVACSYELLLQMMTGGNFQAKIVWTHLKGHYYITLVAE